MCTSNTHPGTITGCNVQAVRQRSYARLRRKVAARAFLAKPAFLACLQRIAAAACKMQVTMLMQRAPC